MKIIESDVRVKWSEHVVKYMWSESGLKLKGKWNKIIIKGI